MTPKEESVDKIMQAYLKTSMSEKQFEAMVLAELTAAETRAGVSIGDYDKGFSDGYDAAMAEK